MDTGAQLRSAREALGLSQEALARLLGCGVRTVYRIEKDEGSLSERLIALLHEHLRMPLQDLIDERHPDGRARYSNGRKAK